MNKSIGYIVVCVLGLTACNVEHYDDDCGDVPDLGDDFDSGHGYSGASAGGHGSKGGATSAGNANGANAGSDSGASGGSAGSGSSSAEAGAGGTTPVTPPATPCEKERDCAPGYNCNLDLQQCQPADEETCAELDTEAACTHRSDCTPIYGGTNCSCGQDCECHGGDPGCVCESFQFFVCQAVE